MSGVEGLAHVGLRIADARRSGRFYAAFGFRWTRRDRRARVHVMRHASGFELNLVEKAAALGGNVLMEWCAQCPGYTHVALRVRNVRAMAARLRRAGVRLTEGPVVFGDGSTSIFVRDPDGNVVELTQPRRPLRRGGGR